MANLKKIVEEYFNAIPSRDYDKVRELLHPDYVYMSGDGERHKGVDAAIEVGEIYTKAFPDLKVEIRHMYVSGDVVITEAEATGTHNGELFGIAPTGRKSRTPICNVIEVRDGKIYAEREYYDMAHVMRQVGVDVFKPKAIA